jgi:hypothetical protein
VLLLNAVQSNASMHDLSVRCDTVKVKLWNRESCACRYIAVYFLAVVPQHNIVEPIVCM